MTEPLQEQETPKSPEDKKKKPSLTFSKPRRSPWSAICVEVESFVNAKDGEFFIVTKAENHYVIAKKVRMTELLYKRGPNAFQDNTAEAVVENIKIFVIANVDFPNSKFVKEYVRFSGKSSIVFAPSSARHAVEIMEKFR